MRSAHIPCLTTLLVALAASPASAQMSDVQRDRVVNRACEAAIWGMPAALIRAWL